MSDLITCEPVRLSAPIIVTAEDCPVLIPEFDGPVVDLVGRSESQFVRVGDVDVGGCQPTQLPGIRVGDGEGSGYVLRRALDGQIVFIPDAGYTGVTTFPCTVQHPDGSQVTLVTSVNVLPAVASTTDITFADGSCRVGVTEGLDVAILGALSVRGVDPGEVERLQVFETDAGVPSDRFAVSGGKLVALQPLKHATDGSLRLRVVAVGEDDPIAISELTVEVRASHLGDSPRVAVDPNVTAVTRQELLHAETARDQFRFFDGPPESTWHAPVWTHEESGQIAPEADGSSMPAPEHVADGISPQASECEANSRFPESPSADDLFGL